MGTIQISNGFAFEEERHRYLLEGVPIPGLTQAIRLTGFVDDEWYTDEARDRGTRTHSACQFLAEDDLNWDDVAEDIRPRVLAFKEFLDTYKPTLINAEVLTGSRVYRFGCRHDFLFEVPALGGLAIIEVKTGKAGLPAKLQTAGQKIVLEEWFPFKNLKRYAFELSKAGKYKLIPHTEAVDRPMILNAVAMVNRRINEGELRL